MIIDMINDEFNEKEKLKAPDAEPGRTESSEELRVQINREPDIGLVHWGSLDFKLIRKWCWTV